MKRYIAEVKKTWQSGDIDFIMFGNGIPQIVSVIFDKNEGEINRKEFRAYAVKISTVEIYEWILIYWKKSGWIKK